MTIPIVVERPDYTYLIFTAHPLDTIDDNVDVEIRLKTGQRFFATFFTIQNVRTLMHNWEKSGEDNRGQHFWAADMIIVKELTEQVIDETIQYLYENAELESVFSWVWMDEELKDKS